MTARQRLQHAHTSACNHDSSMAPVAYTRIAYHDDWWGSEEWGRVLCSVRWYPGRRWSRWSGDEVPEIRTDDLTAARGRWRWGGDHILPTPNLISMSTPPFSFIIPSTIIFPGNYFAGTCPIELNLYNDMIHKYYIDNHLYDVNPVLCFSWHWRTPQT